MQFMPYHLYFGAIFQESIDKRIFAKEWKAQLKVKVIQLIIP